MMSNFNICVFAGSNTGIGSGLRSATRDLGRAIGRRRLPLLYGGGHRGLMGVLADSALDAGGHVTGVIPRLYRDALDVHPRLSKTILVDSIQERKAVFRRMSFAYIALPGGIGTLDEITDAMNAEGGSPESRPCILFNVDGFYKHFIEQLLYAKSLGMIPDERLKLIFWNDDPEELAESLAQGLYTRGEGGHGQPGDRTTW